MTKMLHGGNTYLFDEVKKQQAEIAELKKEISELNVGHAEWIMMFPYHEIEAKWKAECKKSAKLVNYMQKLADKSDIQIKLGMPRSRQGQRIYEKLKKLIVEYEAGK